MISQGKSTLSVDTTVKKTILVNVKHMFAPYESNKQLLALCPQFQPSYMASVDNSNDDGRKHIYCIYLLSPQGYTRHDCLPLITV